jgi:hypothetical protein
MHLQGLGLPHRADTFRRAGLARRLPTLEQAWMNKRLGR